MYRIRPSSANTALRMKGFPRIISTSRQVEQEVELLFGVKVSIQHDLENATDDFEFGMEVERQMQAASDANDKKFQVNLIDRVDTINISVNSK